MYRLLVAILSVAACILANSAFAQDSTVVSEEIKWTYTEQLPQFKGGDAAMFRFLSAKLKLPKNPPAGKVVISFVIGVDGSVNDVEVVQSISPQVDEACVNAVLKMNGRWQPGMQNNKLVPVRFTVPIFISPAPPRKQK
ncbi:energy transducer TonB [uncultured Pontibacter sp.]|uniref:energy transducer TonB n=1 Tax=uncultured Pontibacter sp. TaxID=453356 RepID=UPI00261B73FD|nr:energy transducer TonB [uncultured Pontibacter sp.]